MLVLSSEKLSCIVLQRSSKTRERSSSCSTTFLCCSRLTWPLGEHIISSMLLYTLPSLQIPSTIFSMVAEDKEVVAFRLCSCSSTSTSLERGLEGKLADLRMEAMVAMGAVVFFFLPLEME
uniref:Uncharacterized protein n=1 Tax=Arundo donax TaxID=35708 RepID=A0A0A9DQZ0_ARUDO